MGIGRLTEQFKERAARLRQKMLYDRMRYHVHSDPDFAIGWLEKLLEETDESQSLRDVYGVTPEYVEELVAFARTAARQPTNPKVAELLEAKPSGTTFTERETQRGAYEALKSLEEIRSMADYAMTQRNHIAVPAEVLNALIEAARSSDTRSENARVNRLVWGDESSSRDS